jgi:hypothetical protein
MIDRLIESGLYYRYRPVTVIMEVITMAAGSYTKTFQSHLECSECGTVATIWRKRVKPKEKNHVKHMYCYKCMDTTAHIEKKEELFYPQWLKDIKRQEELEYEQYLAEKQSGGELE